MSLIFNKLKFGHGYVKFEVWLENNEKYDTPKTMLHLKIQKDGSAYQWLSEQPKISLNILI